MATNTGDAVDDVIDQTAVSFNGDVVEVVFGRGPDAVTVTLTRKTATRLGGLLAGGSNAANPDAADPAGEPPTDDATAGALERAAAASFDGTTLRDMASAWPPGLSDAAPGDWTVLVGVSARRSLRAPPKHKRRRRRSRLRWFASVDAATALSVDPHLGEVIGEVDDRTVRFIAGPVRTVWTIDETAHTVHLVEVTCLDSGTADRPPS